MERTEIEGMLNRLGVKKDELSEQGKPLDELNLPIAQLVIAQQLMLLVEQGARTKVDCRRLAENIIGDVNENYDIEDWETQDPESYKDLVSSVEKTIRQAFHEK